MAVNGEAAQGDCIQLAHGGGGALSQRLIRQWLMPALAPTSTALHDAALLATAGGTLAVSTDSFVVKPLVFAGGDIGRLAVLGSLNDLAMVGARPLALSLGLILEEGLPMATLERVIASIRLACEQCDVAVITGDTKVVERGHADGVFINTTAIGEVEHGLVLSPLAVRPGDAVLVSGDLGRHGLAILAARPELGLRTTVCSDLAPLHPTVQRLLAAGLRLHCLRDLTRGGLGGAIDEIARDARCVIELDEPAIPHHPAVDGACALLGLDPLTMANEGRMVVICPANQAEAALALLRAEHPSAARIGTVIRPMQIGDPVEALHPVKLRNALGVLRPLDVGRGEQLPRIC
jgi:hydrogenase expression/formation protein HypE